jgi:protein subunit release factor B
MFTILSFGKLVTNSMMVAIRNSYKSSISLEKLYPKSSLDILEKPEIKINNNDEEFSGFIPIEKIQITKTSSSKPGGQNVNKSKLCGECILFVELLF